MPSRATVTDVIDLVGSDHVGRHEVHDIAHWPQKHAALQRVPVNPQAPTVAPVVRLPALFVADELDRRDHPRLPDLRDVRMILQLPRPRAEMLRQRAIVVDDVVFLEDRERRQRGDAGERGCP